MGVPGWGSGLGQRLPLVALTLVAALSALLAVLNYFLAASNTGLIAEVRERQQVINQGIQLSPLNVQLTQLIGTLAQRSGDIDLRAVLERHGITLSQQPQAAATTQAPPAIPLKPVAPR